MLRRPIPDSLADEWDKTRRLKRGGGREILSFDAARAVERYHWEPVDLLDAAKLYERRWVTTLFGYPDSPRRMRAVASFARFLSQRGECFALLRVELRDSLAIDSGGAVISPDGVKGMQEVLLPPHFVPESEPLGCRLGLVEPG